MFGFSKKLVKLFASYFLNREQRVVYDNIFSHSYFPTSSVIQGSKLSGLFFAILIDGISEAVNHSDYLLYADDFKIFKVINTDGDHLLLQEDINSVSKWLKCHLLNFSIQKCQVMTLSKKRTLSLFAYRINDSELKRVTSSKDLGVIFQSNLSFCNHVSYICENAYVTLGMVIRNSGIFRNIFTIKNLYTALVRSKLEYASVIWAPKTKNSVLSLEKIQARFVRFLFMKFNGFYPSYPEPISYKLLIENLDIQTLEARRNYNSLILLYNILNSNIDIPSAMNYISIEVPLLYLRTRENPPFFTSQSTRLQCT